MPKFTDLPIATDSKDNDIVCVADPDANVSKQMTLAVLKAELSNVNFFGGTIAPLVLPLNGDPIQILNTFSKSGGDGIDPVAGTMNIPTTGVFSFRITITGSSDFSTANNDGQWNNILYLRIDDGVGGVTDSKIGSFSSWVQDETSQWSITTTFIGEITGSPTTTVSYGIAVEAGEDADTYVIDGVSIFLEEI